MIQISPRCHRRNSPAAVPIQISPAGSSAMDNTQHAAEKPSVRGKCLSPPWSQRDKAEFAADPQCAGVITTQATHHGADVPRGKWPFEHAVLQQPQAISHGANPQSPRPVWQHRGLGARIPFHRRSKTDKRAIEPAQYRGARHAKPHRPIGILANRAHGFILPTFRRPDRRERSADVCRPAPHHATRPKSFLRDLRTNSRRIRWAIPAARQSGKHAPDCQYARDPGHNESPIRRRGCRQTSEAAD
jgi:hypothetical protein